MQLTETLSQELGIRFQQVAAAVKLLDGGATVPFVARYRKEITGGMDDAQLRYLETRLPYLRELEERREVILRSLEKQGQLSVELSQQVRTATTKTALEDLYLPYKPKRRTKAQLAREAGLEPLAWQLLKNPALSPECAAKDCLNPSTGIADRLTALEGARWILIEHFAEEAELRGQLREYLWQQGELRATVQAGKERQGNKFADYFAYREAVHRIPSHRALALFRGRNEGVLKLVLDLPEAASENTHPCAVKVADYFGIHTCNRPADAWLWQTAAWAWKIKLHPRLEADLMSRLREQAETTAIQIFSRNLRNLLLAAPAGARAAIGLDPGLRTGVKVAVVDKTGKLLETTTIYPHPPQNQWKSALQTLLELVTQYAVELFSIGNGTAFRETDQLVAELITRYPHLRLQKLVVSEAGASVYSASEVAAHELPEVDVSLRGAVSIARRLQDPLAELVKIAPKAVGVGQYQHDVNQTQLSRALANTVEDCVNAVGVDLNTASSALLAHVSGFTPTVAHNVVAYRDNHGPFTSRQALKAVPRFGLKTFELAAGFLRIRGGENPLDASAVHPEAYPVVERILKATRYQLHEVIGNTALLKALDPSQFVDEQFGLPTVQDLLQELDKPGRDPRPAFKTVAFNPEIKTLADLKPGMVLEGIVTNVTAFGAFVDVGVHQDGLVHLSALAHRFVTDPHEIVAAGDIATVKVVEVDSDRKRIRLTMRLDETEALPLPSLSGRAVRSSNRKPAQHPAQPQEPQGAMAKALLRAQKRK